METPAGRSGSTTSRPASVASRKDSRPASPACDQSEHKGARRTKRCRNQEWRIIEFRKWRLRHDAEQQGGQRNVEQEEVHPCQTLLRQAFGLATGEADERSGQNTAVRD